MFENATWIPPVTQTVSRDVLTLRSKWRLASIPRDAGGPVIMKPVLIRGAILHRHCALITARARTSTSVPVSITPFRFQGKPNDPVDRLRSEMICCLGWAAREIRKHQRDVRNLEVRAAAQAD